MARPQSIEERDLLSAAREVFVTRGAQATTRDVADAAGVSQALLFQRFGTKQRLFFAAMIPPAPAPDAVLGEVPKRGPANARAHLVEVAGRLLTFIGASMPGTLRAALHPDFPATLEDAHAPAGIDGLSAALAGRLTILKMRGDLGGGEPLQIAVTLLDLLHG